MSEATLLSTSTPDPQKTALKVFNHLFPSAEEKEVLVNAQLLKAEYPHLLDDILGKLLIFDLSFISCSSAEREDRNLLKEFILNTEKPILEDSTIEIIIDIEFDYVL